MKSRLHSRVQSFLRVDVKFADVCTNVFHVSSTMPHQGVIRFRVVNQNRVLFCFFLDKQKEKET